MSDPFVGEIRMFGANFAPVGWALCNGQLLAISQNDALFSLIGTTYGGDGQTTFGLPNLQSRLPVHVGNGFALGQVGGSESVTLTTGQLPAHSHVPQAQSGSGNSGSPQGDVWAATSGPAAYVSGSPALTPMSIDALALTGGSQPHDNLSPYLVVNFIIALEGIFPPQP